MKWEINTSLEKKISCILIETYEIPIMPPVADPAISATMYIIASKQKQYDVKLRLSGS